MTLLNGFFCVGDGQVFVPGMIRMAIPLGLIESRSGKIGK